MAKTKKAKSKVPHLIEDRPLKGRPSKPFDPDYCEMLVKHLEDGLSFESFGGVIDCCKQTLYHWAAEYPEFMDAKNRGFSKGRLFWEKTGNEGMYAQSFKDADGMTVTRNLNPTIWIFNMKNRFGWKDRLEVEEKEPEKDKSYDAMTDQELINILKKGKPAK